VPASGDDLSGGLEPLFEQCEAVHEQAREIERQPLEQAQQRRTEAQAQAAAILEQARGLAEQERGRAALEQRAEVERRTLEIREASSREPERIRDASADRVAELESEVLECVRRCGVWAAPNRNPGPLCHGPSSARDVAELEREGRRDLLAGEVELARRADAAVDRGAFAVLVGWVPGEDLAGLGAALAAVGAAAVELPRPLLVDPPTLLRTRGLARRFAPLVGTYGAPRYADLDPTPFAAMSLVFMFGMMFGDAGHGLLLAALGLGLDWSWCSTLFGRSAPAKSRFPGSVYGSLPIHTTNIVTPARSRPRRAACRPGTGSRHQGRQSESGHHAVVTATNPGLRADADIPLLLPVP
jgi:hypothetical protein